MIDTSLQYMPVQSDHVLDLSHYSADAQKNINEVIRIMQERAYGYRQIPYPRLKQTISDQLKAIATGESTPQRAAELMEAASRAEKR
jgi:ABC-type glycerol-3-phosphate transport system substrate-binding protein